MSTAIAQQPDPSEIVGGFLGRPKKLFIGGEWVDSASRDEIPVIDPASERQIASVPDANAKRNAIATTSRRQRLHCWSSASW